MRVMVCSGRFRSPTLTRAAACQPQVVPGTTGGSASSDKPSQVPWLSRKPLWLGRDAPHSSVAHSAWPALPPPPTTSAIRSAPRPVSAIASSMCSSPPLPRFPTMSVFLDPRQDLAEVSCLDIGVGPYNNPGPRGSGNYGRGPCPGHCGAALHTRTVTDHVAYTA